MPKHHPHETLNRGRRPSDAARAAHLSDAAILGASLRETSLALEYRSGARVEVRTPDEARAKQLADRLGADELEAQLECYRRERRALLFRARSASRPPLAKPAHVDVVRPVAPRCQRREAGSTRTATATSSAGSGSDGPPPRRRVIVCVVYSAPIGRRSRRAVEVHLEALGACRPALERAVNGRGA